MNSEREAEIMHKRPSTAMWPRTPAARQQDASSAVENNHIAAPSISVGGSATTPYRDMNGGQLYARRADTTAEEKSNVTRSSDEDDTKKTPHKSAGQPTTESESGDIERLSLLAEKLHQQVGRVERDLEEVQQGIASGGVYRGKRGDALAREEERLVRKEQQLRDKEQVILSERLALLRDKMKIRQDLPEGVCLQRLCVP